MRIMLGAAVGALLALAASSGPAAAAIKERACVAAEIAAYSDRVHVFCASAEVSLATLIRADPEHVAAAQAAAAAAAGSPPFYAVSSTDPLADKLMTLAGRSLGEREIYILYDDDPANNPAGCAQSDCRRVIGFRIVL